MNSNLPARLLKPAANYLAQARTTPLARVAFVLDATESRKEGWDLATSLTAQMFNEAWRLGGISIQLAYWSGDKFDFTGWAVGVHELTSRMRRIQCVSGMTQFSSAFAHIRNEHARAPIAAVVIVGDAVEEDPHQLYATATGLPLLFLCQEGNNAAGFPGNDGKVTVEEVFCELARLTRGAYAKFDSNSAGQLADWLRAVAVFVAGGRTALERLGTDGARKLLTQLK
jgi:hypothetical protein